MCSFFYKMSTDIFNEVTNEVINKKMIGPSPGATQLGRHDRQSVQVRPLRHLHFLPWSHHQPQRIGNGACEDPEDPRHPTHFR